MRKIIYFILIIFLFSSSIYAKDIEQEFQGVVLKVLEEKQEDLGFSKDEMKITIQNLLVELENGENVEIYNDRLKLKKGDEIFVDYRKDEYGEEYSVKEIIRTNILGWLLIFFVLVVLFFGKKQGLRSLISLSLSFMVIFYILLPLLLKGYSPIWLGIPTASLILVIAIYLTHGYNRESTVAIVGTILTIFITGLISYFTIHWASLTGMFSDETTYLNISTHGILNFRGLLFTGVVIGILGILDDIAITQVSVVNQFKSLQENLSNRQIWDKAMVVGRDHVGALINTLVLAYAGLSLPLLMLVNQSEDTFLSLINQEVFATEIIRALLGSVGIILAVPITTYLAVLFLRGNVVKK